METCSAEGCQRVASHTADVGRLCQPHFMGWRQYGYVGSMRPALCTIEGCGKKHLSGGVCTMHYQRLRKYGTTDDLPRRNARKVCGVDGCDLKSVASGLCDMHYRRVRRYGSTDVPAAPIRDPLLCAYCGGPRPTSRTKFCSGQCGQRAAYHVRRAAQRSMQLRLYGLTVEGYDAMLVAQGGGCAVCGAKVPGSCRSSFAVDHDHETGRVRGLLCFLCNSGLGYFGDDVAVLLRAVEYLSR